MAINSEKEMPGVLTQAGNSAESLLSWGWTETSGRTAALLEYVGRTALVVTGPFTGRRYFFTRPGAKLAVDARDQRALLAVPVIRPVMA